MKEELVEKASTVMVDVIRSMVEVKDFAIDQAPDVIAQLLSYNMVVWVAWSVLWLLCLSVSVWGIMAGCKLVKKDDDWVPVVIISVVGAITFACSLYITIFDGWLKIWLAPKVWLLEYAASLAS